MGALHPKVAAWKREATDDPEGFWGRAAETLPWFRKWERVLEWEPPTFRWYRGGLHEPRLQLRRPPRDDRRGLAHRADHGERARRAAHAHLRRAARRGRAQVGAALRGLGHQQGRPRRDLHADLRRGDRAHARRGAHRRGHHRRSSPGFGAGALGERIRLAGARAVFATDVTYRKGKDVPLKQIVDDAVAGAPTVERVVVLQARVRARSR